MKIQPITYLNNNRYLAAKNHHLTVFRENNSSDDKNVMQKNDASVVDNLSKINNSLNSIVMVGKGVLVTALLCTLLTVLPKKGGSTKTAQGKIKSAGFESLKDNIQIPKLEDCKSLNAKLKNALENQILYLNSSAEVLVETGADIPPNRFLLAGPPGVGKTFFAKILAKTIGADYKEIRYHDFSARTVGEHNENFKAELDAILSAGETYKDKKFVVAFNEIDAIIQPIEKMTGSNYKSEERSIFLNYIDEIMDKCPNVIIVGTTNAPAKDIHLDGAALSRFKNIIDVPFPEKGVLYEALKSNIKGIKNGDKFVKDNDMFLSQLAEKMEARVFSFRDLEFVVKNSTTYFLKDRANGYKGAFKQEYLQKAMDDLAHTDGEITKK